MLVSVLIATHDREAPLRRCLESVLEQDTAGMKLEIIVFDDASQIPAEPSVRRSLPDPRIRWLRSETNVGVVGARNALLAGAKGDALVFLDDDAHLADPNCLQTVARSFREHPRAGLLAGKVLDHREGRDRVLVPFPKRSLRRDPHLLERPSSVGYFLGGLHAVRRETANAVGGYEPSLVFGEEEMDLAYRVVQAGWEIRYVPEFAAHHRPPPDVRAALRAGQSRLFYAARNRFYLAHTYLPVGRRAVYLMVWMTVLGLRSLREGGPRDFVRGLREGLRARKKWPRRTLDGRALTYLRANHGRVWY